MKCNACNAETYSIYNLPRIPLFQNKLLSTHAKAISAPWAAVDLRGCPDCGLVFNGRFNNALMEYNADYQNSQDHSPLFREYLDEVADLIIDELDHDDDNFIVEIGCGDGHFTEMLRSLGFDVEGYDPSYKGKSAYIKKENYSSAVEEPYSAIIMRHTLEHIENPHKFLLDLKASQSPETQIFIEVPRFEWIYENHAFWDIFHEHCNYFTESFMRGIFSGHAEISGVFNDQYMLVSGRLGDIADKLDPRSTRHYDDVFTPVIQAYRVLLANSRRGLNYVWGTGAKGIAFVNLLDPHAAFIDALIDIHPDKQNKFTPLSGHGCLAPASIAWDDLNPRDCLWIMNDNYTQEILNSLPPLKCQVAVLARHIDKPQLSGLNIETNQPKQRRL